MTTRVLCAYMYDINSSHVFPSLLCIVASLPQHTFRQEIFHRGGSERWFQNIIDVKRIVGDSATYGTTIW